MAKIHHSDGSVTDYGHDGSAMLRAARRGSGSRSSPSVPSTTPLKSWREDARQKANAASQARADAAQDAVQSRRTQSKTTQMGSGELVQDRTPWRETAHKAMVQQQLERGGMDPTAAAAIASGAYRAATDKEILRQETHAKADTYWSDKRSVSQNEVVPVSSTHAGYSEISPYIHNRPPVDILPERTPLYGELRRVEKGVSEHIPDWGGVIESSVSAAEKAGIDKHLIDFYNFTHRTPERAKVTEGISALGEGTYTYSQEHPVEAALYAASMVVLPGAIGAAGKTIGMAGRATLGARGVEIATKAGSIPGVKHIPTVGFGALYGFSEYKTVTAPVPSGIFEEIGREITPEGTLITRQESMRKPTTDEMLFKFGGTLVRAESLLIGAGLYGKLSGAPAAVSTRLKKYRGGFQSKVGIGSKSIWIDDAAQSPSLKYKLRSKGESVNSPSQKLVNLDRAPSGLNDLDMAIISKESTLGRPLSYAERSKLKTELPGIQRFEYSKSLRIHNERFNPPPDVVIKHGPSPSIPTFYQEQTALSLTRPNRIIHVRTVTKKSKLKNDLSDIQRFEYDELLRIENERFAPHPHEGMIVKHARAVVEKTKLKDELSDIQQAQHVFSLGSKSKSKSKSGLYSFLVHRPVFTPPVISKHVVPFGTDLVDVTVDTLFSTTDDPFPDPFPDPVRSSDPDPISDSDPIYDPFPDPVRFPDPAPPEIPPILPLDIPSLPPKRRVRPSHIQHDFGLRDKNLYNKYNNPLLTAGAIDADVQKMLRRL